MSRFVDVVRRHAVITATGAAVVLAGAGVGAAAVVGTQDVSDTTPAPSTSAGPTAATSSPSAATMPAPGTVAVVPQQDTDAATVGPVTEPDSVHEPAPAPQHVDVPTAGEPSPDQDPGYDPTAPWTDSTGKTYVPAPPVPVAPLPGEDVEEPA